MKTDYIEFFEAKKQADILIESTKVSDKRIGIYIYTQIYTGLRYSDVIKLTNEDLTHEFLDIKEKKTKKHKRLHVHPVLRDIINKRTKIGFLFLSNKKKFLTSQYISRRLKLIFDSNNFNISTHSLRKSFGRHFYNVNGQNDNALTYLSEIFNHASILITKKYLGIRSEEIKIMQFNM